MTAFELRGGATGLSFSFRADGAPTLNSSESLDTPLKAELCPGDACAAAGAATGSFGAGTGTTSGAGEAVGPEETGAATLFAGTERFL
jgi:hypothetical protein